MLLRVSFLALACVLASGASAQIIVNSTADVAADDGQCTLREAIVASNTDTASGASAGECAAGDGEDLVRIDLPAGSTITLTDDLPTVTQTWALEGPTPEASGVIIDGDEQFRIFDLDSNNLAQTHTLRRLTVQNGRGFGGGGINVGFQENCVFEDIAVLSNVAEFGGGGIFTGAQGTCTMDRVYVADNEVLNFAGGGGIRVGNSGSLTIRNSTIANNRSPQSSGGGILVGFFSEPAAAFVMEQCTVSGNTSGGGGGGVGAIGANGSTTIRASIIVGNSVTDPSAAGGGLSIDWDLTLESTVIAGNSANRGSGEWDDVSLGNNRTTSNGGNLVGINGFFDDEFPVGAPNANGDYVGNEAGPFVAMIEPLADNGGPMPTHLPMAGSPMLDAGVCPGSGADQRGSAREVDEPGIANANGDACDMGPVEGRTFTVDAEPLAQRQIRLHAPAPNPARGLVWLAFETEAAGDLSLTVVDLLGREVATLARGPHAAGEHIAALDTRPLAPGVYLVRLITPEAVAVQRVTVVR